MTDNKRTMKMKRAKETKHKVVFESEGVSIITSVYVDKAYAGDADEIEIIISKKLDRTPQRCNT